MEAIRSTETSVYNKPIRRHIPDDGILYSHRRKNLKFYKINKVYFPNNRTENPRSLQMNRLYVGTISPDRTSVPLMGGPFLWKHNGSPAIAGELTFAGWLLLSLLSVCEADHNLETSLIHLAVTGLSDVPT
jgi:hypothetical protein